MKTEDSKGLVKLKEGYEDNMKKAVVMLPPVVRFEDSRGNFFELRVSVIDGKWTIETNEGADLDFLVKTFLEKLLIEISNSFNKRVELYSHIDFLGLLYIDKEEHILKVQNGERYVDGKPIDDFIKELDPELQMNLIKTLINSQIK